MMGLFVIAGAGAVWRSNGLLFWRWGRGICVWSTCARGQVGERHSCEGPRGRKDCCAAYLTGGCLLLLAPHTALPALLACRSRAGEPGLWAIRFPSQASPAARPRRGGSTTSSGGGGSASSSGGGGGSGSSRCKHCKAFRGRRRKRLSRVEERVWG